MVTNFEAFEDIKNCIRYGSKRSKSSVCTESNNCTEKI